MDAQGLVPVDQSIRFREPDLYRLFYTCAYDGVSRESIFKERKFITRTRFFAIQKSFPEWVEKIAATALADVLTARREELVLVSRRRLAVEIVLADKLLAAAPGIVDQIITATKEGNKRDQLRAAELAQKWLSKGFAFTHEEGAPSLETKQVALAYNPHVGLSGHKISPISASLEFSDGTKVEITAPDVVDGEVL